MPNDPQFWVDVFKLIVVDLLLSGDNAVVIALACRNLPHGQRKKGILLGMAGAIVLRVTLTMFAAKLLTLPYLHIVGAFLLLWIGIKLLLPEHERDNSKVKADTHLWGAVKTIIIADFVMSLDNVLGVAAIAKGNFLLLLFGLMVSIPMIAWSSQLVLKLIDRFPIIIYFGGGLLGYVAGEMLAKDETLAPMMGALPQTHWLLPIVCAALVIAVGYALSHRKTTKKVEHLAAERVPAAFDANRNDD